MCRKDVIDVLVNTCSTVTRTENTHCGVNDTSLSEWHKLDPIVSEPALRLLAVTESSRHWHVVFSYVTYTQTTNPSVRVTVSLTVPTGAAHHTII